MMEKEIKIRKNALRDASAPAVEINWATAFQAVKQAGLIEAI